MTQPYFLLLLPLLILYWWLYRREERQRGVFSTFFLWDFVLQEANASSSKRKFTWPWLEWLGLFALILSLTGPFISWKQPLPSVCILLDCSLSMETKDFEAKSTRFEQAIQWIKQQSFSSGEIISFPQKEKVMISEATLNKKCTGGTLLESDIFEAVQQYKKNNPLGKVIWVSDRPLLSLDTSSSWIDQQVLFGTPETNNAGIVFASVKGFSKENKLFVLLHNWARFPQKRILRIRFPQEIIYEQEVILPARREKEEKAGELALEIPFVTKGELLTFILEGEDSLASDDILWLNPAPSYKIYVEEKKWSEGVLLQKFLARFPGLVFVSEAKESDVAISVALTEAPWTICVSTPLKETEEWKFGELETARITWQKQNPLLEGISFVGKEIQQGKCIQKAPSAFVSYVEANSWPILGEYKHSVGGGWFFWGLPLARKMLDSELGFFLCNLLEREYSGSPLWSHFLKQSSLKEGWKLGESSTGWISAAQRAETDNRGETRLHAWEQENPLQEKRTIFLDTSFVLLAAFCLWLSWILENRGGSFLLKSRGTV